MKTNIIFDGNYIFHKCLHSLMTYHPDVNSSTKFLINDTQIEHLLYKVITDLMYQVNLLCDYGARIVFVVDSPSWRKKLYDEYKANRKDDSQKDTYDLDSFYTAIDTFGVILKEFGAVYSKCNELEGDDLIMGWVNHFANKGESSIIISADKDLYGLVQQNEKYFIGLWNNNKFIAAEGFMNFLKHQPPTDWIDGSNSIYNQTKRYLLNFIQKNNIDVIEIEPTNFIFCKILYGDDGDNIPSVALKAIGSKNFRVSEKKAQSIWNKLKILGCVNFNISDFYLDSTQTKLLTQLICNEMSIQNNNEVYQQLLSNIQLMYLNTSVYPEYIIDLLNNEIEMKKELLTKFTLNKKDDFINLFLERNNEKLQQR